MMMSNSGSRNHHLFNLTEELISENTQRWDPSILYTQNSHHPLQLPGDIEMEEYA